MNFSTEELQAQKNGTNSLLIKPEKLSKLWLSVIIAISALLFAHIFSLHFVTFDEELSKIGYLFQNSSWVKLQKTYIANNNLYNVLSFAFFHTEFGLFGFNPKNYHVLSWLLHTTNVGCLYYAIWLLTKRNTIAIFTALFFALHPTHSESVAWILGQGELLMTLASLASIIFYIKYLQEQKVSWFYVSFGLFVLAVLFKFTAVVLPIIFILIAKVHNENREKEVKATTIQNILLFIVAILGFGVWAMLQLKANEKTFFGVPDYNVFDRFILVLHTIGFYIYKTIIPISLSFFYPYPAKSGLFLAWYCYIFALLPCVFVFITFKLRNYTWVYFGLLFFLVNIFLVSNILPLGGRAFANDKQLYFSSIGIFLALGYGLDYLQQYVKSKFQLATYLTAAVAVLFAVLTFLQNRTWQNGITAWDNVVANNPDHYYGHWKRGDIHSTTEATYRQSMIDLNNAVRLMPEDANVWNARGYIHMRIGDYIHAEEDLKNAVSRNPRLAIAYFHLAHVHKGYSRFDEALKNYDLSIEHDPNYAAAFLNRGGLQYNKKDYQGALRDFNRAIELDPNYAEAYQNRGNVYYIMQDVKKALEDYNTSLKLYPQNPDALLNRGMLKIAIGRNLDACIDLEAAQYLGNQRAAEMVKQYCKKGK